MNAIPLRSPPTRRASESILSDIRPAATVRIIGGKWRGRKIPTLSLRRGGADFRPTTGRIRESVFQILEGRINSADCLDLFAGSGALGLEAVSRGANSAMLIESDSAVFARLRRTAEWLGDPSVICIRADAFRWLKKSAADSFSKKFSVVFLDPPFAESDSRFWRSLLHSVSPILTGDSAVYCESRENFDSPDDWRIIKNGGGARVRWQILQRKK